MRVSFGRVYDVPVDPGSQRVLVDRLWPRGMTKERAALDEWCKNVAPSPEHREQGRHDQRGRRTG
ncbi:DUF488 family protein [Actinoplanes sp. TRM 88003]|uniref:DUF488 family protein n=1 Tax=Paractinoplanes aksuensis TaxID=2939490 RepID=A0ABT1E0T9_9ACTN|nr:DUF488 family protein [Actinoplanes aksuensis]